MNSSLTCIEMAETIGVSFLFLIPTESIPKQCSLYEVDFISIKPAIDEITEFTAKHVPY